MQSVSRSVIEAVQRVSRGDSTLAEIILTDDLTEASVAELADCLLAHPNAVTRVYLGFHKLTDATGVKLARYLAASSTLHTFNLCNNHFGEATYLAMAAALRVNTSLQYLFMNDNPPVDRTRIEAAFMEVLRLNPDRPAESFWCFYSFSDDFKRLREAADQLGHPSLQLVLAVLC